MEEIKGNGYGFLVNLENGEQIRTRIVEAMPEPTLNFKKAEKQIGCIHVFDVTGTRWDKKSWHVTCTKCDFKGYVAIPLAPSVPFIEPLEPEPKKITLESLDKRMDELEKLIRSLIGTTN